MKHEDWLDMSQCTECCEQYIAADSNDAQGHHRSHAECEENACRRCIAKKVYPGHL
jgi:hypothetical protein